MQRAAVPKPLTIEARIMRGERLHPPCMDVRVQYWIPSMLRVGRWERPMQRVWLWVYPILWNYWKSNPW
jgi:hypothetical protein